MNPCHRVFAAHFYNSISSMGGEYVSKSSMEAAQNESVIICLLWTKMFLKRVRSKRLRSDIRKHDVYIFRLQTLKITSLRPGTK